MTSPAQVLVVGAGPTGLALAAELARRNISVRIIDQNTGPSVYARAIAIHARTLEVFADMDLLEPILEAGQPIHGASVYAHGKRVVHFTLDELDSPYRFAVDLPQSETERILTAHLETLGVSVEHRTILGGFTQDAEGVTASLRRDDGSAGSVRVEYLAGCDGLQSTVRHIAGIPFEGEPQPENFLVADARIDWTLPEDEWTVFLHEEGLLTAFPLPGGNYYRIVADNASAIPTPAELQRVWTTRAAFPATPSNVTWISGLRIATRKVARYRDRRIFLAGDAAHIQNPSAAQGMNTGIQDAYNLAWKLALVLAAKSPDSLLDSYTAEREPVARGVLDFSDNLASVASLRSPISQAVRNRAAAILSHFEVVEQRLVNRLGETAIHYRGSPIVAQAGRWYGAAPLPGDRAPALPTVLDGAAFKVLLFTGDQPDETVMERFETTARYMRDGYPGDIETWLIARQPIQWPDRILPDPTGAVHHRYGAGLPCIYCVRPDKYIGFRSLGCDPLPLLEHLGTIFDAEPKPSIT